MGNCGCLKDRGVGSPALLVDTLGFLLAIASPAAHTCLVRMLNPSPRKGQMSPKTVPRVPDSCLGNPAVISSFPAQEQKAQPCCKAGALQAASCTPSTCYLRSAKTLVARSRSDSVIRLNKRRGCTQCRGGVFSELALHARLPLSCVSVCCCRS